MDCPICQHGNPEGRKFCNQCGALLATICPSCGAELDPGSVFCGECGHELSQAAAISKQPPNPVSSPDLPPIRPEGERRQATVLFADLSGYTAMNERLDPEEVQSVMSRIKAEAVVIVESHGGSVNQFVGDEILALFGIPVAHKDDPARAVRAAQELHEMVRRISPDIESQLGQAIRLHSGIATGLVVTHHTDDRDGRVGITGDTVNIGARLKTQAPEDAVLISPETRRAVMEQIELAQLDAVTLKGRGEKLTPYRVIGEIAAPLSGRRRPFVGRQAELRQIAGAIEACGESGSGQAIVIRGDPGIGKTRLAGGKCWSWPDSGRWPATGSRCWISARAREPTPSASWCAA